MRKICFLVVGIVFLTQLSWAQNAKYHRDIVYRLSKHITWSGYDNDYKFVIGVVGSSIDFHNFQSYAADHGAIHDVPVEVRYFDCTDDIDECDLIYISEDCSIELSKITRKTRRECILIVSAKDGHGKPGAVINFVDSDGKLKFELDQKQARERGLKVTDDLKSLAILI